MKTVKWTTLTAGVACWAAVAGAASNDFTLYHVGNSLTGDLWNGFKLIGSTYVNNRGGTYTWGAHYKGGSTLTYEYNLPMGSDYGSRTASVTGTNTNYSWHDAGDPNATPPVAPNNPPVVPWTTSLPGNHWDAVTLQFSPGPTAGSGSSQTTMADDTAAVKGMIDSTLTNASNSTTRFFLYQTWTEDPKYLGKATVDEYWRQSTANTPATLDVRTRAYSQNLFHSVKAAYAAKPDVAARIAMIPVGEVIDALEKKMQPGGTLYAEGLTDARQFHRDVIHGNILGSDIAAYTAYATIFQKSPVGLPSNPTIGDPYSYKYTYGSGSLNPGSTYTFTQTVPTPAALQIIQQTVWDVVNQESEYTQVPEPMSAGIVLGGMMVLGLGRGIGRRRHDAQVEETVPAQGT